MNNTHPEEYKYLKFIHFKHTVQWYVEYYLNESSLRSKHALVPLKKLIEPRRDEVKKEDYEGIRPIVEKIVFKTGKIVFRKEKTTGMDLYALQPNDLLISSINFHQGATALNTFGDIVASTHYQPYIINAELVDPEFLTMVLRTPRFLSVVSGKKAQGIKNESGYKFIGAFPIPLPPLEEQKKLVGLYNTQMENAQKLDLKVKKIETSINTYLLDSLGLSTEQTEERNAGDGALPNGYKHIHFARLKNMNRWDVYNENSITKSKLYQNVYLGDLVTEKPQYGAGYRSRDFDGKVRYIRITDINEDGSLNDEKVSATDFSEDYLLKGNDFLIARSGNTVGKTFLYKNHIGKSIYAGYLIRFRLDETKIIPEYLLAYTKSSIYKEWIKGNMRVSAQPNINSQQYLNSPIILPPLEVQTSIAEFISKKKEVIKDLRQLAQAMRMEALNGFENDLFE